MTAILPPMTSRFEINAEKRIQEAKDAMVKLQLGDSHGHAELKGIIKGWTAAVEEHRKSVIGTVEDDDLKEVA